MRNLGLHKQRKENQRKLLIFFLSKSLAAKMTVILHVLNLSWMSKLFCYEFLSMLHFCDPNFNS